MRSSMSIAHYASQGFMSAKGALQPSLGRRPRLGRGPERREPRGMLGLWLIEAPPQRNACRWQGAFTALLESDQPNASWVGAALSLPKPGPSTQAMLSRALGAPEKASLSI